MGDETRPPLFPARSSSMFYVYMVFADILAQQTTNVKQNQVLGITETVGFTMMCDTGAGAVEMWKTAVVGLSMMRYPE